MRKIIHNATSIALAFLLIRLGLKTVIQVEVMYNAFISGQHSLIYGLHGYEDVLNVLNVTFTALYALIKYTNTEKRK